MASPKQINQNTGYGVDRGSGVDNPFAGTVYADMWENNPYRYLYYDPSFWDNIGLSNKSKDANNEYQRLYDEYIAGIYELQREDAYNSESAQVARQRQAGLNPDLLGVQNSQAGHMQPPNAGMNPALTGRAPVHDAFSTITQVLGFATSTLSQIKNIQALTDNTELSAYQILQGPAKDIVTKEFGSRLGGDGSLFASWDELYDSHAPKFTSPRNQRRMKDALHHAFAVSNSDKIMYDYNSDTEESRFRYGRNVGHPDWSADDKAMFTFIKAQMDFERLIQKIDMSSGAVKKRNEALLSNMRQKYYNYMYDQFINTGSLLAGLLLLGQQPTIASYYGSAGFGVEKDINIGLEGIKKFFSGFKF